MRSQGATGNTSPSPPPWDDVFFLKKSRSMPVKVTWHKILDRSDRQNERIQQHLTNAKNENLDCEDIEGGSVTESLFRGMSLVDKPIFGTNKKKFLNSDHNKASSSSSSCEETETSPSKICTVSKGVSDVENILGKKGVVAFNIPGNGVPTTMMIKSKDSRKLSVYEILVDKIKNTLELNWF